MDSWRWYLALGGLSVLKALALRNNRRRFRRELLDAGLFAGVGLLLYRLEGGSGSQSSRSDRWSQLGQTALRSLGGGDQSTGEQLVRVVDRAEPVVRETVLPALQRRLGRRDEPEGGRLGRLRRRLPT